MTTPTPLISVIMPVRNGMPYIADAVQSVRNQTLGGLELIVVDDGSTDCTRAYLESLDYPEMVVIPSQARGAGAARRSGVKQARGRFIAWMDADDIAHPERLEVLAGYAERHPSVVAVGSQVRFLVANQTRTACAYPFLHEEIVAGLRTGRPTMCNSSLLIRADAIRKVRMQPLTLGEDMDLLLRLSGVGRLENVGDVLLDVRISRSSSSYTRIAEQRFGTDFAVACDEARRSGRAEPERELYSRAWKRRPLWRRASLRMFVVHQRQFRESVILSAEGRTLRARIALACSALFNPSAVVYQLRRKLMSSRENKHELQQLARAD
ncbi:MAG TPA: glycosyltransferase family 2 protein [Terracidiphilus sp.]|nr:glycosyltransferase family 2 protein [Terracidiphilus sp.]